MLRKRFSANQKASQILNYLILKNETLKKIIDKSGILLNAWGFKKLCYKDISLRPFWHGINPRSKRLRIKAWPGRLLTGVDKYPEI